MTDSDELVELLPCPFCGGDAVREDIPADDPNNENAGASYITCKACWASTRLEFGRKENLRSAWNTRAALSATPLAQMREAHYEWREIERDQFPSIWKVRVVGPWVRGRLTTDRGDKGLEAAARAALTGEAP